MANCTHGFPQDQCLICQTLGAREAAAPDAGRARTAERSNLLVQDELSRPLPARATGGAPFAQTGQPVQPGPGRPPKRRSGKATVVTGLAVIVVGGLLVWAFAGLFELAFHLFEFAALALVAGWVGYKIGHAVGRHDHEKERGHRQL